MKQTNNENITYMFVQSDGKSVLATQDQIDYFMSKKSGEMKTAEEFKSIWLKKKFGKLMIDYDGWKVEDVMEFAKDYHQQIQKEKKIDDDFIIISREDLKTFYDDVSGEQTGWSDSSYPIARFLGINPEDGI